MRRRIGACSWIACAVVFSAPLLAEESGWGAHRESLPLVKVQLNREIRGMLFKDRFIPQTRIREKIEFNGIYVSPGGYVLSYVGQYGSLMGAQEDKITLLGQDGSSSPAQLIGVDERISLAVFKAQPPPARSVILGEAFREGPLRLAYARRDRWEIVSPGLAELQKKGWLPEWELQLSTGAGADRCAWDGSFLLDPHNRLLGIITHVEAHPFSKNLKVCRLLPVEVIRESYRRLLEERQNVEAGWLGVYPDEDGKQIRIKSVVHNSPAEKSGLRGGDVIVALDGLPVSDLRELIKAIRWKGAGSRLSVQVVRQGKEMQVETVLSRRQDRRPATFWRVEIPEVWRDDERAEHVRLSRTLAPPLLMLGFVVEPLTPQLARYFHCPEDKGLLVKAIREGSPAEKFDFRAGDVLTAINGQDLFSISDLETSLAAEEDGVIVIQFVRNRQLLTRKISFQ